MICSNCGTENPTDQKFCGECGAPLVRTCPACGTANPPANKFCGQCGAALGEEGSVASIDGKPAGAKPAAPAAERRLVSVLFADLVGFTAMSESRDPEEVRDLLTRYFDAARLIVGRYGGVVEKFIGDAVMAVWGTPVAQEDDAERAVRSALELVDAVAALGAKVGAPELRARAGVLTGEAAVTIGAEGQGMVAGDLVNAASRVQSVAEPGTVLVGESTRRATEVSIVHEPAGSFELKGKSEPVPLWRARRVVAGVGGALKSERLEAPFVGRERELRLVKDLFHSSVDEGKAHLVSIVGIAGIGKSRLAWEFYKYFDGLREIFRWHRGRCLAYGEGVAYWALAEMVRGRAEILEGEDPASAAEKVHAAVERYVPDPQERRWAEPRLAHLLGLEERTGWDREDLFAAWRLFFERMAEERPVVMAFEDCQWADAALLDFIEYLLEWSRHHRIFVLTMARPELRERRPGWGTGRSITSLYLEPLSPESMRELLAGLVPGLPGETAASILERAEGVPLYAVETVRMLLDKKMLVADGDVYRPAGTIESLEVPETLHALIAARLDGLTAEERGLVQDASVLGKTFNRQGLAALTGTSEQDLEGLLTSLVRKEILGIQADPRSPERGQYGFLQDLVKTVAYETLSKKDRKARHLRAAGYLERDAGFDEQEIVEVVASHYLDAYRSAPDAPDAADIRARARDALVRAGRRAQSLAATADAERYFQQASELAQDTAERATLIESAGLMAWRGGSSDRAMARYEEAFGLFEESGSSHAAARVSARIGEILWVRQETDQAVERMEASFAVLADEEPDEDLATLATELARVHYFRGDHERALERAEFALPIAESLWLPEVLSQALNTKHLVLHLMGRRQESMALLKHALDVAVEADAPAAAVRAYVNLSYLMHTLDREDDALEYQLAGIALARRAGIRWAEWFLLGHLAATRYWKTDWEGALAVAAEIPEPEEVPDARPGKTVAAPLMIDILIARGQVDEAERLLARFEVPEGADVQEIAGHEAMSATVRRAQGRHEETLELATLAFEARDKLDTTHPHAQRGFKEAVEAALALRDLTAARGLVEAVRTLPPGDTSPSLMAHVARFDARIAAEEGRHDVVEAGFKTAEAAFREIGLPFDLAVTLLEHGTWLLERGDRERARPLVDEAREIFDRLQATPWLERVEALESEQTLVS